MIVVAEMSRGVSSEDSRLLLEAIRRIADQRLERAGRARTSARRSFADPTAIFTIAQAGTLAAHHLQGSVDVNGPQADTVAARHSRLRAVVAKFIVCLRRHGVNSLTHTSPARKAAAAACQPIIRAAFPRRAPLAPPPRLPRSTSPRPRPPP